MDEELANKLISKMDGREVVHAIPIPDKIGLAGDFTADELEAIAWWMKNKKVNN